MKTLQPLADNVVVKPLKKEMKTESGIVLPDSVQDKSQQGQVVAVGKDVKEVSPGDVVIYKEFSAHEVKVEGEKYLIVPLSDVLAVVVESSKLA